MFFAPDGEMLQDFKIDLSDIRYRDSEYARADFALTRCIQELDHHSMASRHEKAKALRRHLINVLSSNLAKPDVEALRGDIEQLELSGV